MDTSFFMSARPIPLGGRTKAEAAGRHESHGPNGAGPSADPDGRVVCTVGSRLQVAAPSESDSTPGAFLHPSRVPGVVSNPEYVVNTGYVFSVIKGFVAELRTSQLSDWLKPPLIRNHQFAVPVLADPRCGPALTPRIHAPHRDQISAAVQASHGSAPQLPLQTPAVLKPFLQPP